MTASAARFCYRLFFTRDDDLDLLQVAYLALLALSMRIVWLHAVATGYKPSTAAWTFLAGLLGTLVLAAVPKWVGELMVRNRAAGELARAVASSGSSTVDSPLPRPTDDERD